MNAKVEALAQKQVPWGGDMNWNYDTLPDCDSTHEKASQVPFPNVGANCRHHDKPPALSQGPASEDVKAEYPECDTFNPQEP